MTGLLPVLDNLGHADAAARACGTCHGGCCVEYSVPASGYDLVRLMRGLGLAWDAIVTTDEHRIVLEGAFRLDRGPVHTSFVLRRRPTQACVFLLEIRAGRALHRRCGVHGLRPDACRIYPAASAPGGSALMAGHAICPPPQAAIFGEAIDSLQPLLDEDGAEQALYARILQRWDQCASRTPQNHRRAVSDFIAWIDALYAAIEPLRASGPRGAWQLDAYAIAGGFPLPA